MAKDDFHVIVYQILAYLYKCLKDGKQVEPKMIENYNINFTINEKYWEYIMYSLMKDEYIDGLALHEIEGKDYPYVENLEKVMITPKGIEYLCDNSFMNKAKRYVRISRK